ncbi:hypothetical protein ACHAPU_009050 [Fusarium lateritium]
MSNDKISPLPVKAKAADPSPANTDSSTSRGVCTPPSDADWKKFKAECDAMAVQIDKMTNAERDAKYMVHKDISIDYMSAGDAMDDLEEELGCV